MVGRWRISALKKVTTELTIQKRIFAEQPFVRKIPLDMDNKNNRQVQEIKRVTVIGMIANVFISGIKFIVGVIGNSQAVIADAVHSVSDLSTDFAVLIGVKYWSAPPDEDHPYGHLRIEAVITIIIGIALVIVAIGLGYRSLSTIREVHIKQTAWVAIIGPLVSIIVKEILFRWTMNVGSQIKSTAVIANAWHHRSDALSSMPALIAVAVSAVNPKWAFVDHIGAIIISLFILKVSWDIIRPSLFELTDKGASQRDKELIKTISLNVSGVRDVHAIRTRKFGSQIYIDLHILVDPDISVREGHQISENVRNSLLHRGPSVIDVIAHIESYENGF
jgi:cation diffusion facilitator family transporter